MSLSRPWPTTIADATAVQQELRHRVRHGNDLGAVRLIGGVDVSYDIKTNLTRAFIVLLDAGSLHLVTSARAELPTLFPYVPGFLSFREIPAIFAAFDRLPHKPDLLMVDGAGVAHPRRFGIACHLGVLLDLPSIGVAKSRLTGRHAEPGPAKGDAESLFDRGERIGTVLRSKDNVKPLYVSPGHRLDQNTALDWVNRCLAGYRLPEPTRLADKLSKQKPALQPALF